MDRWTAIMQAMEAKFNELIDLEIIKSFKLGRFEPSKYDRPIIGIIPIAIRTERTKTNKTQTGGAAQLFEFIIRTVVDADPDAPLPENQNAVYQLAVILKRVDIIMSENPTWGGLAADTWSDEEESTSWPWSDVDLSHAAADKKYMTRYQEEDIING